MNINIKRLNENAVLPTRGSEYAAGYDLYAATTAAIEIQPHSTVKVGTGLAFELPEGFFGGIFARSGIATKRGLRPSNCCGIIDADYRGECIVALHNDSDNIQIIEPQERIAQIILLPFCSMEFNEIDELSITIRGTGGFGSSGRK